MAMRLALASILLTAAGIDPSSAQAGVVHAIDIPAQELGSAIATLAKQARIQVVYAKDLVEGQVSYALSGSMTPEEALGRLLSETGLRFEFIDEQTVTLLSARESHPPGRSHGRAPSAPSAAAGSRQDPRARGAADGGAGAEDSIARGRAGTLTALQALREDSRTLQEITITATRQAETLNRVPLTVAAITQEMLDMRGVRDVSDLGRIVPALSATGTTPGRTTFSIRGIVASSGAATTGVYLDDTSLTKRSNSGVNQNNGVPLPAVFDLERIEVLKGPQGTLYGGSSQGGTVRIITPTPSLTGLSGFTRLQLDSVRYGELGYEYGGAVSGPIVQDRLGVRVSAVKRRTGGWIDEVDPYTGGLVREDGNSNGEWAARVSALWALSDRALLTAAYYHASSTDEAGPDSPTRPLRPGQTFTIPQACYDLSVPQTGVPPSVSCPAGAAPPDIFVRPAMTVGPFDFLDGRERGISIFNYRRTVPTWSRTDLDVTSATFDFDFGGFGAKSITSYIDDRTDSRSGDRNQAGRVLATLEHPGAKFFPLFPLFPGYLGISYNLNDRHGWSQELRLSSHGAQRPWSWVSGLYYSSATTRIDFSIVSSYDPILRALFGVDTFTFYGMPKRDDSVVGSLDTDIVDEELAAFGEANYWLTERMKLIAGLRVSRVSLDFYQLSHGITSGRTADDPYATAQGTATATPISPKLGAQYQLSDNRMIYATAAKGFRAGGVNVPVNPVVCATGLAQFGLTVDDIPRQYGPDTVWSYELGGKLRLLEGRMQLNLAAFRIDWEDVQSSISAQGCAQGWVQNGAKARSEGVDLQAELRPIAPLTFSLAAAYTDARYLEAVTGPAPLSGALPTVAISKGAGFDVPPFAASVGAQYNMTLGGWDAFVRADYQFASSYTSGNDFGAANYSPYRRIPRWHRVDLRAGMSIDRMNVQLFISNLLDDNDPRNARNGAGEISDGRGACNAAQGGPDCTVYGTFNPFVGLTVPRPRVFGLQVNYRLDR